MQGNQELIQDLSDLEREIQYYKHRKMGVEEIRVLSPPRSCEAQADLDYCNGTSYTVSHMSSVTHCSIPRMHLDVSKWADMGGSCFLHTLPG